MKGSVWKAAARVSASAGRSWAVAFWTWRSVACSITRLLGNVMAYPFGGGCRLIGGGRHGISARTRRLGADWARPCRRSPAGLVWDGLVRPSTPAYGPGAGRE